MTNARADVVVVAYYPGDTLAAFLASVVGQASIASVTVVDNAPDDAVAPAAAAAHSAHYVPMTRNAGYGTAANAGAALGTAEWIIISNSDIEVSPGAIAALIAAGEASQSIGMVGPEVRESDGSLYPSARPLPTLMLGAGHAVFGKVWPGNPWTRRYRIALDRSGGPVAAGWLSGSFFAVRRTAWEQVGGFDEDFFMFFEDVDLGRRLGQRGWERVWVPGAAVTHLGGHSYRSDPAPMLAAHHDAARRYVRLVYPHWWQAPIRTAVAAGLKARQRAEIAAARKGGSTTAH